MALAIGIKEMIISATSSALPTGSAGIYAFIPLKLRL